MRNLWEDEEDPALRVGDEGTYTFGIASKLTPPATIGNPKYRRAQHGLELSDDSISISKGLPNPAKI